MPRGDLRHAHPMFFVSIVADLVTWFGVGLVLAVGPADWSSSTAFGPLRSFAPTRAFGLVFLALGAMLVYGVARSWRWAKRSMILGAGLIFGFAAAFIAALIQHKNAGVTGIFLWTSFGINLLAQTGEPPRNPASAVP